MIAYWLIGKKGAEQRSEEAKPLDDGRFCRLTDLEDGSQPTRTYGKTVEEVFAKVEKTAMHARTHLAQVQAPRQQTPPAAPKPGRRLNLTADEQMQATLDLQNPATAPAAMAKLFESHTGVDIEKMAAEAFGHRVAAWGSTHPEIKNNLYNQRLICDNAILKAGGNIRLVDAAILEQAFVELSAGGYILTDEDLPARHSPQALPVPPDDNPASRTRQTDPAFATSHRLNRTGSTQVPQWQPKYTREQIDRMPLAESGRLLKAHDKDYADALNYHYPPRQARA